jgi:hypothetical protein
MVQLGEYV